MLIRFVNLLQRDDLSRDVVNQVMYVIILKMIALTMRRVCDCMRVRVCIKNCLAFESERECVCADEHQSSCEAYIHTISMQRRSLHRVAHCTHRGSERGRASTDDKREKAPSVCVRVFA